MRLLLSPREARHRSHRLPPKPQLSEDDAADLKAFDAQSYGHDPAALMYQIDSLPRPWRDLVNDFGFSATMNVMRQTSGLGEARSALNAWRHRRQLELSYAG